MQGLQRRVTSPGRPAMALPVLRGREGEGPPLTNAQRPQHGAHPGRTGTRMPAQAATATAAAHLVAVHRGPANPLIPRASGQAPRSSLVRQGGLAVCLWMPVQEPRKETTVAHQQGHTAGRQRHKGMGKCKGTQMRSQEVSREGVLW